MKNDSESSGYSGKMTSKTKEFIALYKKWVMENPTQATDVEVFAKWFSYLLAGKINNSSVISEFIYSISNLFTFYNDMLIRKSQNDNEYNSKSTKNKLKTWLTILHYCEVFVEIISRNKWGNKGKWSAATIIQVIRCISNLILIYKYHDMPLLQPPIPILQRKTFVEEKNFEAFQDNGFKLKRSKRVIRRVEAAVPVAIRNWKPLEYSEEPASPLVNETEIFNKKIAETLYAIKPLIHLGSIACFGSEAWKQWLVNLGVDLSSLHLYSKLNNSLNYDQRLEIDRRKLCLLLYLLRSPMYQKHSSSYINRFLTSVSRTIPLCSIICNPILQYISHWQDTYFYMWPN